MTPSATASLNGTPSWLLFSEQSFKSHAVDDDASREGLDNAGSAKDWRAPASKWPLHPQGHSAMNTEFELPDTPAAATAAAARLRTRRQPVGKCFQDSGRPLNDGQKFAHRRTVAIEDRESIRAQVPATSSAALSTRRTFSPASLARSAPDHPRSARAANRRGYPDTSSRPSGMASAPM